MLNVEDKAALPAKIQLALAVLVVWVKAFPLINLTLVPETDLVVWLLNWAVA